MSDTIETIDLLAEYERLRILRAENERLRTENGLLRDAIKAAIENIDADDVIGAHDRLQAALKEKE